MTDSLCVSPIGLAGYILNLIDSSNSCHLVMQDPVVPYSLSFLSYLKYFFSTMALELPLYYLCLRRLGVSKILLAVLIANLLTHPFIFFALPRFLYMMEENYFTYLLSAEIFAPVVETIFVKKWMGVNWKTAAIAAFTANIFSWGVGVFVL